MNKLKIRKFITRVIVFLISIALSFFMSDIISSIYVRWYAVNERVPLETLSEDYFMGFTSMIVFLLSFIVLLPLTYWRTKMRP